MFASFIRPAWRYMSRNRVYSFLNIAGFSLGLAACMIIVLSLVDDLMYDRYYSGEGRLYRIYDQWVDDEGQVQGEMAPTTGRLVWQLTDNIPEVLSSVRIQYWGPRDVHRADQPSENVNLEIVHADTGFIPVFGYEVLAGSQYEALRTDNAVILTPRAATLLFGNEDPIGKPLSVQGIENAYVAAVIEAPPARSHMQFDVVIPFTYNDVTNHWLDNWNNFWVLGYVRLADDADPEVVSQKMYDFFAMNIRDLWGTDTPNVRFPLMPIEDIHLHSSDQNYNWINFNAQSVEQLTLLGTIALSILLLASINFINLSSATAMRRAKEVGLRKTVGADLRMLRSQYLAESVFTTLLATALAVIIVEATVPALEPLLGKNLSGMLISSPMLIIAFLAAALVVGLLSGIYPALVLTAFTPIQVLRGDFRTSKSGRNLRRVLVLFQFTISIALFIAMLIMTNQLKYVMHQDWGYNRDQVMIFQAGEGAGVEVREAFLARLQASPLIVAAGSSNMSPGENPPYNRVLTAGPSNPDSATGFVHFDIRSDWFETLQIPILQGRRFYNDNDSEMDRSVILNESAVERLGLEDPVGQPFYWGPPDGLHEVTIIGVVPDFHFGSAKTFQQPAMFHVFNEYARQVVVRLPQGQIQEGIEEVERIYREFFGGTPTWSFLDDHFAMMYAQDQRLLRSVMLFSILAIVIACLGILGLSSYSTEQRRREIAIRKVLGAGETSLMFLLNGAFLKWVLFANIVAWPLAGWGMNKWLQQYAYHTSLNVTSFIIAGGIALTVAIITVSSLTLRIFKDKSYGSITEELMI